MAKYTPLDGTSLLSKPTRNRPRPSTQIPVLTFPSFAGSRSWDSWWRGKAFKIHLLRRRRQAT